MKKQVLLSVCFRIQGKKKQKIHFTNANTNNEKKCQCHIMIYESFQSLLKDVTFSKLSFRQIAFQVGMSHLIGFAKIHSRIPTGQYFVL